MTEIVQLTDFSLGPQGPTASIGLAPGQSLAVVGPAASGKTRLLKCLVGEEKAAQGRVHAISRPAVASREGFSKRSTPQSIVRNAAAGTKGKFLGQALIACGLWDLRQRHLEQLSSSQIAACELLSCLGLDSRLLVIDGQLDRLDPWTLSSVLDELRARLTAGAAVVAVTNRPELLIQFDCAIVLDRSGILFAGSVSDLLASGNTSVEVESRLQPGTRALAEPLTVDVEERSSAGVFSPRDGQAAVASLLLEGYGDVRYVVLRQPSPLQALMRLTKTPIRQLNGRSN